MKKNRLSERMGILIICLSCLFMSGCSLTTAVENLLSPPKLTEDQNEIYQELINSVGKNVKLKYPRNGDYRSAFVIRNIDDEPGDEALVFYESKDIRSGESALRLKFLDSSSGKWESTYDLACPGNEIDSVVFACLGESTPKSAEISGAESVSGSGSRSDSLSDSQSGSLSDSQSVSESSEPPSIVLSYTLLNQTEKAFSVLKYKDKKPFEQLASTYSCMEVADINKDNQNELIIVNVNKELKTAYASMYTDGGDRLELISNTPLYGGAADYIRVTKGNLNKNTPALFLDYSKGGGQSGTDVLYCYGSRLFCPDSVGSNPAAGIISRQVNDYMAEIYSFDIDNDGFVEIPSTTPLPGYETLTKPEQICAVQWYTVQNDNFTQKAYSYFSGKYRFALLFPNRWMGVVSAIADFNSNDIIFISYDAKTGLKAAEDNEIMRIHVVEKETEEDDNAVNGMRFLGESEDIKYYAADGNFKNKNLSLTESEFKDSFVLL